MMPGILFVGNFLSSRGSNRTYCEEMADRIELRGWRVFRTSDRANKVARLADMVATAWRHRRDYDVAHVDVFSGPAFVWAEVVCFELRRLGKPYALTLRGGNLPAFASRWPRRVARLLESAAAVTTPSRYLASDLSRYAPNLVVVPNAVDVAGYTFSHRTSPRAELVWIRAFHEVYNPVMAVDVLAQIAPQARLTMIGVDKGAKQAVEQRAHGLGLADRVTVIPGVPKRAIPDHLARADIFLNTTNVDNTPISVIEAMAAGLCIVSTDAGGIPYLLEHERDALLTPIGDAPAMAAAVNRILVDRDLASRLSASAHEHARRCDWAVVLPQWEALLGGIHA